ncbi:MAG: DUF2062 domain-containing protein [Gallionella sp.]|jgi:hypothetical protein|nr:DUF2062 domain-containing protein [Gallionella sp.]
MRKFLRRFIPHPDGIRQQRWLRPFGSLLHQPGLWHLHRRSVAGGVAVGLFCGLIPGPLQMLTALLLALLFRVNLPVAAFATLYTNPFTIIPLYLLAYRIGLWVGGESADGLPLMPELHWHNWSSELWPWLETLGRPLLLGLPLLALGLAALGYVLVRGGWRLLVVWKWRHRKGGGVRG